MLIRKTSGEDDSKNIPNYGGALTNRVGVIKPTRILTTSTKWIFSRHEPTPWVQNYQLSYTGNPLDDYFTKNRPHWVALSKHTIRY